MNWILKKALELAIPYILEIIFGKVKDHFEQEPKKEEARRFTGRADL